jgi:vacuolar-type H+-ATPase subunit I/STV1
MVIQRLWYRMRFGTFRWYVGINFLVSLGRVIFNAPIAGTIGVAMVLVMCSAPDPIAKIESARVRNWSYTALVLIHSLISFYASRIEYSRL